MHPFVFFFRWEDSSVFPSGHDGPKPRLQAADGCEVFPLKDRCVIALGEGVRLQVRVTPEFWGEGRATKPKQIEGVIDVKKHTGIWCYRFDLWWTCTNVYSSHVHFKICIVCGCVSESRAPPSALYMNLGRAFRIQLGFDYLGWVTCCLRTVGKFSGIYMNRFPNLGVNL